MYRKLNIATVLSAMMLTACTADDVIVSADDKPAELMVMTSVAGENQVEFAETRSTASQSSGAFVSGEKISVYAVQYNTKPAVNPNSNVTAHSTTGQPTGYYWPNASTTNDADKLDIYAWYPASAVSNTALNTTNKAFTIKANQSGEANYRASDLMFASSLKTGHTKGASQNVALSFSHKLTRIQVKLEPVAPVTGSQLNNATITIGSSASNASVIGNVTFNVSTGGVSPGTTRLGSALTLCSSNYDYNAAAANNGTKAYAVIPPQNLNGLKVNVTLSGGATISGTLPSKALESGNAYTYTVKVNATRLTVTASISDWGNGGKVADDQTYYF